ncbi:MAG: hypothetical protein EF807_08485 [Candidatus Methanolliviera hydrocarbonicum]|uniref:SCP2 domain-containing protein n=1 Tax=Candidatus Methanolliviera hydrocarbonicum TaxID=2491085 RepID=A0A520KUI1_9EURY|nr:MAG: hypothetical protein EF807_08485 [Candidatus Methanolliviera hydrocarbonicum]
MPDRLKELLKDATEEKEVTADDIAKEVERIVSEDEEIKKEISLTEEMIFNVKIGDTIEIGVKINGDELSVDGVSDEPDFFIDISPKILSEMLSGDRDVISSLMGGDIVTWREGEVYDASKLNLLVPLMMSFARKLEFRI